MHALILDARSCGLKQHPTAVHDKSEVAVDTMSLLLTLLPAPPAPSSHMQREAGASAGRR